jgi:hypothetical protein
VLGAGVSGDLGYVAAIERSVAGTRGWTPQTFTLGVTTIFRREAAIGGSSIDTETPRRHDALTIDAPKITFRSPLMLTQPFFRWGTHPRKVVAGSPRMGVLDHDDRDT